jgi:hypothetical protein
MKPLIIASIYILTLIFGTGYLSGTHAVQILNSVGVGAPILLAVAEEAEETSGDESGQKTGDVTPGIDRIASSVCCG